MSSKRIATNLAEEIAADWKVIPKLAKLRVIAAERNVDISRPTAILRQKRITRFPEAPKTHRQAEMLLTIVSDRQDFDAAADEIEEWVYAALDYLDTRFRPSEEADAVLYNERFAYDIPFTVITDKE